MEPIRGTRNKRTGRVARRLAVAVGSVVAMLMMVMQAAPASADHPGTFEVTAQDGSGFIVNDSNGNPISGFLVGTSACEDDFDNDADGDIDFDGFGGAGPDPECASADDENERLAGSQSLTDMTFVVDIDAAGNVTLDPADWSFPEIEGCFDFGAGPWCLGATLVGSGPVQSGFVDPVAETMELDFEIGVEFDVKTGYPGFVEPCTIGPISGTLAGEYDHAAGTATIGVEDAVVPEVPATTDCGNSGFPLFVDYDNAFNQGLPGDAGILLIAELVEI